jgi:predicted GNAT family acetyltransferase
VHDDDIDDTGGDAGEELLHDEAGSRYLLRIDGRDASFASYRRDGGVLVFDHTVTDPEMRGRGLAAKVVRFALDDVKARGAHIRPRCWFVANFVRDHPEYESLVG